MAAEESRWPSVLVLLAHPRPGSFNHDLTDRVVTTLRRLPCHVIVHDLYADTVQRQHWLQQIGDRSAQLLAADGHPAS